jgi:hypothetical protein
MDSLQKATEIDEGVSNIQNNVFEAGLLQAYNSSWSSVLQNPIDEIRDESRLLSARMRVTR